MATDMEVSLFCQRQGKLLSKFLHQVVYIRIGSKIHLKTAFEPNAVELAIYRQHGGI